MLRTLRQLGTGTEHRENFQRRQLVRNANRNSYSTLLDDEAINVLTDIEEKQARWVKELKPIAGRIRATSVSPNDFEHLQPLLNQVLRFQQFRAIGVPVDKCMGPEWDTVLTTLTPDPAEPFSKSRTKKPETAAAEEPKPATTADASPASKFSDYPDIIFISAKTHDQIKDLKLKLLELFDARTVTATDTIVTNARHANSLKNVSNALQKVLDGLDKNIVADLLALDIRYALDEIGTLTGEVTNEDLLTNIFSKFCIGK